MIIAEVFIGFYDKPFLKFERILETYLSEAPLGFKSFSRAIDLIAKCKGKVILAGIGKSGLISRKISLKITSRKKS